MSNEHVQTVEQPRAGGLPYLPALDGLRALAVAAVLAYHGGLALYGGFLGVETFFALSGFLITALLLAEWRRDQRIDLLAFWRRRALRLLPALLLLLAATTFGTALVAPDRLGQLAGDSAASLAYIMNWHLVWSERSYFDASLRPPLLQHLWSLAVEEQFYLLWPLLVAGGLRALRRGGLLAATIVVAAASSALMSVSYDPGADPSRVYYGTDTRASGLLLGAALAMVWLPGRLPWAANNRAGIALDLVGAAGLGGLLLAYTYLFESHPLLYRGGFQLVALSTMAVILAATHPRARLLPAMLGWAPLRWLGVRSYGIYLWHWPVFAITRPGIDLPLTGTPAVLLQMGLAVALAALSYRFVEAPLRGMRLDAESVATWRRRLGVGPRSGSWPGARGMALMLTGVIVLSGATCAAPTPPPVAADATPVEALSPESSPPPASFTPQASPSAETTTTARPSASATVEPSVTPDLTATTVAGLKPVDAELAAALQAVLEATVADGGIPGAVASVSIPGHEPWVGSAGLAARKPAVPMTPETRVRIASISKVFTAVVALQLVEEGVLELDAPMSTWLPELVPDGEQISLRNLLQHTSGLYDYLEDRRFVGRAYQDPERLWAPEELVTYANQFPPAFSPGAEGAWDYSSTNFVLLGMIIEQVTDNTLAEEMRARIFEPLGMKDTFFTPDEAIAEPWARGYSQETDQTRVAMSVVFATANLVSTAGDLQRFAAGLFEGELLEPATFELMTDFVDGKGQYNMPTLAYGLGLMRNNLPVGEGRGGQARSDDETTVMGHIGGFGGFRAALWHAPASGVTVAIGVNQAATDPNLLAAAVFDTALTGLGR
jgi:peptidoglycan/LPS O-acetylase OafA/YrhL/CubicO group peptidase (beta-lactamase class C family)